MSANPGVTQERGAIDVHVAMLGARMHYAVPRLLHQAGMLGRFYTDNYIGNKPSLEWALDRIPARWRPQRVTHLLARKEASIPSSRVQSFDWLGLWFAWRLSRARDKNELIELVARRAAEFNRKVIKAIRQPPAVIWGFSGAAAELFQWAKAHGVPCILEQTIAPRTIEMRLLTEERERWPGWEPTLVSFAERDARAEREKIEWALADRIAGASQFVLESLEACGVNANRRRLIPYGVDLDSYPLMPLRNPNRVDEPLRVLFVGEVSLRKGAPYLLEALKMLGSKVVDARFVGSVALSRKVINKYVDVARFVGSLPRSAMVNMYRWADVLCLPSICEGSATVTYEALASGAPVIATWNTGSLVRDGINGFIVPIRDAEAIADRLDSYRADRSLLENHQRGAATARDEVGLNAYERRLVSVIEELVANG